MSATEYSVDRSGWSDGPWTSEPDRLEWRHHEFPCLIVRSHTTGALCGYVGVDHQHPLYDLSYDNISVTVHGGVTYAARCAADSPICHTPKSGESDEIYWIGFDCGHAFDIQPGLEARLRRFMPGYDQASPPSRGAAPYVMHYWTIDEVTVMVNRLAEELAELR